MNNSPKNTAAIILSGGAGSRLNGADKGLQFYNGKALIKHVISVVEPQVDKVYICANRNLEQYRALGFDVCEDTPESDQDSLDKEPIYQGPIYQGPMAGISTVLTKMLMASDAEQVLITSCDVPNLPSDMKARLQAAFQASRFIDVAVVHDGERRQNLHCLIKRQAWASLVDFFEGGGRAMHRWFDLVSAKEVDFSHDSARFLNINTHTQLNATQTLGNEIST